MTEDENRWKFRRETSERESAGNIRVMVYKGLDLPFPVPILSHLGHFQAFVDDIDVSFLVIYFTESTNLGGVTTADVLKF
jgi:hypothetical protein